MIARPSDSATLRDAVSLMAAYEPRWAVTGGWAIDLYLGTQTRQHGDVDIAVLRADQHQLQRLLEGADVRKVANGVFTSWYPGELLTLPIHEIHATWPSGRKLELLLNELDASTNTWVFRRDSRVRRPMDLVMQTADGIPHLSPEVVLLFKAKAAGPKDEADLAAVLPHLAPESRQWLAAAISLVHGQHHWVDIIEGRPRLHDASRP